jgi:long-chain fatty acid transport protein
MLLRRATLCATSALGLLVIATATANAGGFALREQSAYGQGTSYAGVAAGGDLSTMFWNPAVMTQFAGVQTASTYSGIFPYAANTPSAGSTLGILGGTNNTINNAFVPSSYMSMQLNPRLWVGMSFNAPFGLSTSFPDLWAGRDYAGNTTLKTYNAAPSIAFKLNDWISVGAGVQIQYASADLSRGVTVPVPRLGLLPVDSADIWGTGWGYGFTAGLTLTPTPTTTIGLGYRSQLDQKIDGTLQQYGAIPLPGTTNGSVSTTIDLPDVVSLGIRQQAGPQWTFMGTVEWTNWSRIGTSDVTSGSGGPALVGGKPVTIAFNYDDGWFFALGAEYKWTDRLTVRGGVAYEISPITDDVRIPLLPDNDRTWVSVGATWLIAKGVAAHLAYSHAFVRSTSIDVSAASGNPSYDGVTTYLGDVSSHFDIISLGLKIRWDEFLAPQAKTTLYTK